MSEKLTIEIDLSDAKSKGILNRGYVLGLEAAAMKCENWADQCEGGQSEEGYRNLANSIRRIDPAKGY